MQSIIRRNMRMIWYKTDTERVELPDYVERSVTEVIINALVHRDYLIRGSEVHIDMFDDRLIIYSPGGMPEGNCIQNLNITMIPSVRRNPIIADIFSFLGYMERKGSGIGKIVDGYKNAKNYHDELLPIFYSDTSQFTVIFPNLNYRGSDKVGDKVGDNLTKNREQIVNVLRKNPKASFSQIAKAIELSKISIYRNITWLKDNNYIKRIGSAKGGYWEIIDKD